MLRSPYTSLSQQGFMGAVALQDYIDILLLINK